MRAPRRNWTLFLCVAAAAAAIPSTSLAQFGRRGGPPPAFIPEGYDDHQNMMDQLGIKELRPGKSGNNQTGKGFEEASANDWMPSMPDLMTMKDGTKVVTAEQWQKRRAEIQEDFEREVYGRIPANVPAVTWEVTGTTEGTSGDIPTITKTLVGHVDNSAFPEITVNIQASFTVPADAKGSVPIVIEFGGGGGFGGARRGARAGAPANTLAAGAGAAGQPAGGPAAAGAGAGEQPAADGPAARGPAAGGRGTAGRGGRGRGPGGGGPPWTQQAIAHGWGYGYLNPGSVQADSGGFNLRQGIIGLTNKGQPRKPDDWGSLRAWQWGVSRLIDYFEANPDAKVDATKVAIEGVSRYGKAALVTGAFEPRIAVAFVASSGEGGAKLHRHDFGEAVENLTANGEYHWMAGNFLKYGASQAAFGKMDASNMPVDSHELIALCAPRLCFISNGIEPGDPKWIDAHGAYMATVLAGPAYTVLGRKDLGVTENFLTAPMPPVDQLVGGELAWRQHSGGHTSVPNFPTFFEWVANYIKAPAIPKAATSSGN